MNRQTAEVIVMRRPVQRAVLDVRTQDTLASREVREATTGRVMRRHVQPPRSPMGPQLVVAVPPPAVLERVWAVAESAEIPETPESSEQVAPEMAFYRKYTEAMLRRYLRMSMLAGRVPSLMGRELFRGNVTHCRTHTMEDVVIFCMDIEKMLAVLDPIEQRLVTRIALQQYKQGEAAAMLGLSLRNAIRRYGDALDKLTERLLEARMLEPQKSCQ